MFCRMVPLGTQWAQWGTWSQCSATCGTEGRRQRMRECPTMDMCGAGETFEAEPCNTVQCPTPTPLPPGKTILHESDRAVCIT